MCGIIGAAAKRSVLPDLLRGLAVMEYRGYDSAGFALAEGGAMSIRRETGPVARLIASIEGERLSGTAGIAHERWATHGRVSRENAHPHADCGERIAIVHNGIIENHLALKDELRRGGHSFRSETDSEVIAHLIEELVSAGRAPREAVRRAALRLQGAFSFAAVFRDEPEMVLAVRNFTPLAVGRGTGIQFVASDPEAFTEAEEVIFMEDGDLAELRPSAARIFSIGTGEEVPRKASPFRTSVPDVGPAHESYMLKEIREEPETVRRILARRLAGEKILFPELDGLFPQEFPGRVMLAACGTSFHAAKAGEYALESRAGIPAKADLASEFRYREAAFGEGDLAVVLSQSGETADTLAAVREAKRRGAKVLALLNVPASTIGREADAVIPLECGTEKSVASTKAFIAQACLLLLMAGYFGQRRGTSAGDIAALRDIPGKMERIFEAERDIENLAEKYLSRPSFYYLGRGLNYAVALEGALKIKEIAYVHAEGGASGELKHGPLALVAPGFPCVCIATANRLREKNLSNIQEIRARGGEVIAILTEGDAEAAGQAEEAVFIPPAHELLEPLLAAVPLQLFAYHFARKRGFDADRPRNLAKSVTVE